MPYKLIKEALLFNVCLSIADIVSLKNLLRMLNFDDTLSILRQCLLVDKQHLDALYPSRPKGTFHF